MQLKYTTLDVFTLTPYTGNPVAIISVPSSLSPILTQTQKQRIASEFNLSEIVFLHLPPPDSASRSRKIDIFTSHAEVPFAGHPTVGTTQYLLDLTGQQDVSTLVTTAGPIPISLDQGTGKVKAEIPFDFHIHSQTFPCSLTPGAQHPVVSIVNGMSFILASLPSLSSLAQAHETSNINPSSTYDPSTLDLGWQNGILCTMYYVFDRVDEAGNRRYRTRMFGTREDPGTGSASSGLGCFLALTEAREGGGNGRGRVHRFLFEQGVEMGRRNEIAVEVTLAEEGDGIEKVVLSGTAVQVMEGVLEV